MCPVSSTEVVIMGGSDVPFEVCILEEMGEEQQRIHEVASSAHFNLQAVGNQSAEIS